MNQPYPFFLAHPLDTSPEELGEPKQWQVEWLWNGIRVQMVRRKDQAYIWTRDSELVTDCYPELAQAAMLLPNGTVLDGAMLPWEEADVMPCAQLQLRVGQKEVTKQLLVQVPVILMAYDVLEWQNEDIRAKPLAQRRALLESALTGIKPANLQKAKSKPLVDQTASVSAPPCQRLSTQLRISPTVHGETWHERNEQRKQSLALNVEGLILKRLDSPYSIGAERGDWWKWKIDRQ